MSTSAVQARRYYRRKRRLSLAEGDARMSRVHAVAPLSSGLVTETLFTIDQRRAPVAFGFEIFLDDKTARGLMFEFGNATFGIGCWIDAGGILGLSAGRKKRVEDANARPWAFQETAELVVPVGVRVRIVVACRAADGTIRGWVNGREEINTRCADGKFGGNPAKWANAGSGQYFGTPNTSARHIGVKAAVNSTLHAISDLSIYRNQRPRHYNTGEQETTGGGPI